MAEVRFVGGPADGMFREYPGDEPPQLIEVYAPIHGRGRDDAEVVATKIWYATMVNPMNDDPRWLAVLLQDQP